MPSQTAASIRSPFPVDACLFLKCSLMSFLLSASVPQYIYLRFSRNSCIFETFTCRMQKKHLLTRHRQMLSQNAIDWQVPQISDKYFFQPPVFFFKFVGILGQCWVKTALKIPGKPINKGFPGVSQAQLDRAGRGLAVCWRSIPG